MNKKEIGEHGDALFLALAVHLFIYCMKREEWDQPKFPVHALLILNNVVSLPHEGRRYDMGVSSQGFEGSV